MSLVQSLRALLKPNLTPVFVTDPLLRPTGFNAAAEECLPMLTKGTPLPEQFPDLMWTSALSCLQNLRPVALPLNHEACGRFVLYLFPVHYDSGLVGTVCSVVIGRSPNLDASLAVLMHDLGTPISTLRNCVTLLQNCQADPTPREMQLFSIMQQNLSAVQRNLSLLTTALAAERPVQEQDSVSLSDTVEKLLARILPDPKAQAVAFDCLCEGKAIVLANPILLERALLNLITNAIAYCSAQVRISVLSEGAFGLLRVADDGPGIPLEELPHILTPWYTTNASGSGLGLSMVDQFARRAGGRLDVENRNGAVFTLRLPLSQALDLRAAHPDEIHLPDQLLSFELELALNRRAVRMASEGERPF
ncbi:MAG: HAMP domain-containing histidine kinase [Clostridia bacterium]|nr:HAMP domain-containing histidine kinase [Clostridia bacterium]